MSVIFTPLDSIVSKIFARESYGNLKVVCLLSCPRGGSTLTYQVLRSGINGRYLSNLWNLLYATPFIGAYFSSLFVGVSTFSSNYGFVKGLSGEAEGLKFWTHWTGQGIDQQRSQWNIKRSESLKSKLDHILEENEAFITGYLGHVFCIHELRALFPNVMFIYLTRNLLDNACSILRASSNEWFSTRPIIENRENKNSRVVAQLLAIHYIIYKEKSNDYYELNFEELKRQPEAVVDKIIAFSEKRGINLIKSRDLNVLSGLSFEDYRSYKDPVRDILYAEFIDQLQYFKDQDFKAKMNSLLYD